MNANQDEYISIEEEALPFTLEQDHYTYLNQQFTTLPISTSGHAVLSSGNQRAADEEVMPFSLKQEHCHDDSQYMYTYLNGDMDAIPIITSDQASLSIDQKVTTNGNQRAVKEEAMPFSLEQNHYPYMYLNEEFTTLPISTSGQKVLSNGSQCVTNKKVMPLSLVEQPYHDHNMYPHLTADKDALPISKSVPADLANDQKGISNGTLQQLGVGNSTVEVQRNGSHSFLHIVTSTTHTDEQIGNDENIKPENVYFCSYCPNGFRTLGSMKSHERACFRHSIEGTAARRQCKKCYKIFSSVSNLNAHMKRHTDLQSFRCIRCSRRYFNENLYAEHLDWHKRQDELVDTGNALSAQHVDKTLVVKEFKCVFCTDNFTVAFDVGQVRRRYSCDDCRQKYKNGEVPRKSHKPELACGRCGRKFVFHGFLQRHLVTCDGTFKRRHQKHTESP